LSLSIAFIIPIFLNNGIKRPFFVGIKPRSVVVLSPYIQKFFYVKRLFVSHETQNPFDVSLALDFFVSPLVWAYLHELQAISGEQHHIRTILVSVKTDFA
jgi:hypothetical protein